MIRWDEIIETFLYGLICTTLLGVVGLFIFGLFQTPVIACSIIGGIFVVYSIGWLFKNYDDIVNEVKETNTVQPNKDQTVYRIPIVDKIQKLEAKYHISTIEFIVFVHDSYIPFGMDNLDYLEWISLINELPSITTSTQGDDYNG
jgi:hypothetical protein